MTWKFAAILAACVALELVSDRLRPLARLGELACRRCGHPVPN